MSMWRTLQYTVSGVISAGSEKMQPLPKELVTKVGAIILLNFLSLMILEFAIRGLWAKRKKLLPYLIELKDSEHFYDIIKKDEEYSDIEME